MGLSHQMTGQSDRALLMLGTENRIKPLGTLDEDRKSSLKIHIC